MATADQKRAIRANQWQGINVPLAALCAHQLFEEQVSASPDAVALVFRDVRLTYRQLNERANKLARHLRKRGVGPEALVGVCLERTPLMVVALLATWKAGGAYVPLDPTYPPHRLLFMVEDSKPCIVLTEEKSRFLFSSIEDRAICLDSGWAPIDAELSEDLPIFVRPSNLAYVIYTSGSTGMPKGAMIVHTGLVNYLSWAKGAYPVSAGRTSVVHTSISFDLTVTSLYVPLVSGGSVELLPEDMGTGNLATDLLRAGDRGIIKITPSHLALLNHEWSKARSEGLVETFVIGGETLLAEQVQIWRDLNCPPRIVNEYGPTETVVGCCIYEVQPDDPVHGPIPIGWPIANTQMYIVSPDKEPLPVGEMGEIYIGGAGVARGYLNRPELTAERFLADPFSAEPGARLYKTGDLGRRRSDGAIEYFGRLDDQVKIRGYRIELGEIDAILSAQPRIRACAVVATESAFGSKQLVAHVVPEDLNDLRTDDLRLALAKFLPDHMIPAKFVVSNSLPLTPNGKIDKSALRISAMDRISDGNETAAQSETERTIASIWRKVLNISSVGVNDDFFEVAGDSLNAIQVINEINEAFNVELKLEALFEWSTILRLAKAVNAKRLSLEPLSADKAAHQEEFEV